MAPAYFNASSTQPHTTDTSPQNDLVTNIVFGSLAALASSVTIWQGRRIWKAQHERSSLANERVAEDTNSDLELGTWLPRRRSRNNETLDDPASASPPLDTNATQSNEGRTLAKPVRASNGSASVAESVTISDGDGSRIALTQDQSLSSQAQPEEDIEQNTTGHADVDSNLAFEGPGRAAIAG